jgi:hypothetical protein
MRVWNTNEVGKISQNNPSEHKEKWWDYDKETRYPLYYLTYVWKK